MRRSTLRYHRVSIPIRWCRWKDARRRLKDSVHSFITSPRETTTTSIDRCWVRYIRCICTRCPFQAQYVCARVCALADLNRQTGRPCFVRPLLRRVAFSRYRGCWCGSMREWVTSFIGCIRLLANRLVEHRSASSRQGNRLTRMFFTPSVVYDSPHFFHPMIPVLSSS